MGAELTGDIAGRGQITQPKPNCLVMSLSLGGAKTSESQHLRGEEAPWHQPSARMTLGGSPRGKRASHDPWALTAPRSICPASTRAHINLPSPPTHSASPASEPATMSQAPHAEDKCAHVEAWGPFPGGLAILTLLGWICLCFFSNPQWIKSAEG